MVNGSRGHGGLRPWAERPEIERRGSCSEIEADCGGVFCRFTWAQSARHSPSCWAEFFAACSPRGDRLRNLQQRRERHDGRQNAVLDAALGLGWCR